MELENYFEFINETSIRITGTRVGVETVVQEYLKGAGPEEIVLNYPTLSLEQVHATITYYLANQDEVTAYMRRVRDSQEKDWLEQQQDSSEFVRSLRKRLEEQRQVFAKQNQLPLTVIRE